MKKRCVGAFVAAILLLFQVTGALLPISASAIPCRSEERALSVSEGEAVSAAKMSDVVVSSRLWELLFGKKKTPEVKENKKEESAPRMLCPGGDVFGVKLVKEAVSVVSCDEECFFKYGDIIISIDGKRIRSLSDVKKILDGADGSPMDIVIERGGEKFEAQLTPKKADGAYKLGAVLRDGVAGIGTITYYDPQTGEFGGLGHGICEPGSSTPVKIQSGAASGVILGGVDKSESGEPGELTGLLTDEIIGEIYFNKNEGVFGKLNTPPDKGREMLPVGTKSDVKEGEAMIYSTVRNGLRREYKVEIFDVDYSSSGSKSFKVRVTDDALKAITGGIVRGMSGSPIIQNGKLVGAVTHVLVANPTEGYGIFIENMLNAAQNQVIPKAA